MIGKSNYTTIMKILQWSLILIISITNSYAYDSSSSQVQNDWQYGGGGGGSDSSFHHYPYFQNMVEDLRQQNEDIIAKRAPSLSSFMGMRGKKAPSMSNFFGGVRGKKLDNELSFEDWGGDEYPDNMDKRAPLAGFLGMRGKKRPGGGSGFFGVRGKKGPSFQNFFGVRGKKSGNDVEIDSLLKTLIHNQEESDGGLWLDNNDKNILTAEKKALSNGFFGMRGKKENNQWTSVVTQEPLRGGMGSTKK